MHNREITHKVKTDSLSKTQLIVKTEHSFYCQLRETLSRLNKSTAFMINTIQKLDVSL